MAQRNAHDHTGHAHATGVSDLNRIAWAFGIIATFMVVEVVGGLLSGSLALLADAGHMVSDAVALGMSWLAIRIGARPADPARSFGYQRLEVLAAFVNGCALFLVAGWVTIEAIQRFAAPVPIFGGTMMAVAVAGTAANLAALFILYGGNRVNLNVRSAWIHVLGDLFGSVAAIAAAVVILFTGWTPIDPLLSILVAVIILKSAYGIVRSSSHILLEGTPPHVDVAEMRATLASVVPANGVVHHIHVWSLTAEMPLVTLHVSGVGTVDQPALLAALQEKLKEKYGITHVTIQIETGDCTDKGH